MSGAADLELRRTRVVAVRDVATDVRVFELESADGRPLPIWDAGAHLDVHTPGGAVRQYSLCGLPSPAARYRIAVKREPNGRGGSASMHGDVDVGSVLAVSVPRNHFPLADNESRTLLVAGGIGITPLHAMAHALEAAGRDWQLHYCARSAAHAAFHDELSALAPDRLFVHLGAIPVLDVRALLAAQPPGTHVYCCGPEGLMAAVKAETSAWPEARVHFEWFSAPAIDHGLDGPFEVELARSGAVLRVPADRSILDVVREHGIDAASACEEGVCGTCETRVLAGEPEHRDLLLSAEERAAGRTMMICVSRSRSARLVLDL